MVTARAENTCHHNKRSLSLLRRFERLFYLAAESTNIMAFTSNFPHNRKRTVYVGGFSNEVDEKMLNVAFIPFGDIVAVSIPKNYETNEHRGFGYVV